MNFKELSILSFLAILLCSTSATPTPATEPQFLDSLQSFGPTFLSELFKIDGKKNIIYSPFSMQTALAMARMGASGETALEMDHVLGFAGQTPQNIADNYHAFLAKYEASDNLKMANKVYVNKDYELQENYQELLSKKFFASAENIDFGDNSKAAKTINTWVESRTNNKIEDLIDSSILGDDTSLVLVNAIHFKGEWEQHFPEHYTKVDNFYLNEKDTVKVQMMKNAQYFTAGELPELDSDAVQLHYKDSNLSMLIILPNNGNDLPALVEKLNKIQLHTLQDKLKKGFTEIFLPKFKVEYEKGFKKDLMNIGMHQAFDSGADFSKMLKLPQHLVIDEVIHKAFIEVNEHGTEAAAATAAPLGIRTQPHAFRVNHPFYYAIITEDFVPIFQGTIVNFD